jgi:hypothetical protein
MHRSRSNALPLRTIEPISGGPFDYREASLAQLSLNNLAMYANWFM